MFIICFDIEGIVRKKFVLVGQTANSAYHDFSRRLLENVRRLCPELWRQKNWLFQHDKAMSRISLFSRKFSTKNNMTVLTTNLTFLCFPD
jgi:hypothetical protein